MFEAKFNQSGQIKKLIEAIKDVVSDANLECNENGISLQAMDPSHVSLVSLIIPSEDFEIYRCDEPITIGLNLNSFYKILKCSSNEDSISISCPEISDILTLIGTRVTLIFLRASLYSLTPFTRLAEYIGGV